MQVTASLLAAFDELLARLNVGGLSEADDLADLARRTIAQHALEMKRRWPD